MHFGAGESWPKNNDFWKMMDGTMSLIGLLERADRFIAKREQGAKGPSSPVTRHPHLPAFTWLEHFDMTPQEARLLIHCSMRSPDINSNSRLSRLWMWPMTTSCHCRKQSGFCETVFIVAVLKR